jgi:hypothetical protein
LNLTFDDNAPNLLPDASRVEPGFYKPTDFEPGDPFPGPTPAGPYSTSLASFTGISPNGVWSLYAVDDATLDMGNIAGGWSLTLWLDLVQPRLTEPIRLPDGRFQLTLDGQPGNPIVVESSADLHRWMPFSTNVLSGTPIRIIDPSAIDSVHRFYRAVQCQ